MTAVIFICAMVVVFFGVRAILAYKDLREHRKDAKSRMLEMDAELHELESEMAKTLIELERSFESEDDNKFEKGSK